MNSKMLTAGALAATMTFGAVAPALADGAASTRNILIGGAAAAVLITNYNHKVASEARRTARAGAAPVVVPLVLLPPLRLLSERVAVPQLVLPHLRHVPVEMLSPDGD